MTLVSVAVVAALVLGASLVLATRGQRWVVSHPRAILLGALAVSLLAVGALLDPAKADFRDLARSPDFAFRIALDPSSEPLLPTADPRLDAYRRAVLEFGSDDVYVVAMQTDAVFRPESLAVLRRVGRRILALPGVADVESLVAASAFYDDPETGVLQVRRFIEEIPTDPDALADLRRRALADPLYARTLVSDDASVAALNVRFRDTGDLDPSGADLDARIRDIVAAEASSERRFYVSGRPHVRASVYRVMVDDLRTLLPLAVGVMALVLWIVSGSLRGVAMPLGTVGVATLWTFGVMAALGVSLNVITIVLGPTLIAVGGVYGVHVLAHYEREAARSQSPAEAAARLLERTRTAVLISGISTAIGFGALLWTDAPATRELGAFAVLGVAAVTLLSVTALPAVVALLPLRPGLGTPLARSVGASLDRALATLARFVGRRPSAVIATWLVLATGAVLLLPRITVDTDYLSFFPESSRVRRDFAAVNELLSGTVPIFVVLSGEGAGSFREPENLRALERLQRESDVLEGVTRTLSVVDLLGVVRRAMFSGETNTARIPETRPEVAELMLLVPKARMRPLATLNHARANLLVRTGTLGSEPVRDLVDRLEGAIRRAGLPPGLRAEITGETVLVNRSADAIARTQLQTVGAAALAIFALVVGVFRSLRLAAVALVPNVLPVLLFYGLLGAGLAPLSLPTSLIASVALGIAVDDTMHFLVTYRRARREGQDPRAAALETGRRVGRAIAITSVMLFCGFLVVALSGFETLREFGLLIGATLLIGLATDLLLLPALLVRTRV